MNQRICSMKNITSPWMILIVLFGLIGTSLGFKASRKIAEFMRPEPAPLVVNDEILSQTPSDRDYVDAERWCAYMANSRVDADDAVNYQKYAQEMRSQDPDGTLAAGFVSTFANSWRHRMATSQQPR